MAKIGIVTALGAAVLVTVVLKKENRSSTEPSATSPGANITSTVVASSSESVHASFVTEQPLPKLLDLGADKCIPCKMMAPILEELETEYAGRMEVVFIDVWKNPDAGKAYSVTVIPTQIFFDAQGQELFRHTGFFGREDILNKWSELGVELGDGPPSAE